jgi:hypothetical protein
MSGRHRVGLTLHPLEPTSTRPTATFSCQATALEMADTAAPRSNGW